MARKKAAKTVNLYNVYAGEEGPVQVAAETVGEAATKFSAALGKEASSIELQTEMVVI